STYRERLVCLLWANWEKTGGFHGYQRVTVALGNYWIPFGRWAPVVHDGRRSLRHDEGLTPNTSGTERGEESRAIGADGCSTRARLGVSWLTLCLLSER